MNKYIYIAPGKLHILASFALCACGGWGFPALVANIRAIEIDI